KQSREACQAEASADCGHAPHRATLISDDSVAGGCLLVTNQHRDNRPIGQEKTKRVMIRGETPWWMQ
ncbi:MAG TPA: hypothetical protein VGE93_12335, partial [Bryobacteraceae bacterium]